MKKILSIIIILTFIFSINMTLTAHADSSELLENPSFENGVKGWMPSVNAKLHMVSNVRQHGTYSCLAGDKYNGTDGPAQDITDKLNFYGKGQYTISAYVMLAGTTASTTAKIAIRTQSSDKTSGSNGVRWFTSPTVSITNTAWTKLSGTVNVQWNSTLEFAEYYFIIDGTAGAEADYFDNCSMIKIGYSGAAYPTPLPTAATTLAPTAPVATVAPKSGDSIADSALFLNPPMKNRPFKMIHSWKQPMNGDTARTVEQKLDFLKNQGYGGFVTNVDWNENYLQSDDDFAALNEVLTKAKNKDMGLWLYDDYIYPSSSALNLTVQGHPEYEAIGVGEVSAQGTGTTTVNITIPADMKTVLSAVIYPSNQGILDLTKGVTLPLNITNGTLSAQGMSGAWEIRVYGVYPVFVDGVYLGTTFEPRKYPNLLNRDAVGRFIQVTYEQYKTKIPDFDQKIDAFFTDEPGLLTQRFNEEAQRQLSYPIVPWEDSLAASFQQTYGYSLYQYLPSLFGGTTATDNQVRQNFYELVGQMIKDNFTAQIQDWCAANGANYSGHLLLEENMSYQIPLYGDFMKALSGMGSPGIDVLNMLPEKFMDNNTFLICKMAQSVARAKGEDTVMAEICPVSDTTIFNANHHEYSLGSVSQLYLNGINHINEYYNPEMTSNAQGLVFNNYVARMDYMLSGAKQNTSIAIYYPIETAQQYYTPSKTQYIYDPPKAVGDVDSAMNVVAKLLTNNKLDYNILMSDFISAATVQNGNLVVNGSKYSVIVLPDAQVVPLSVMQKLDQFATQGGKLIFTNCLPSKSNIASENAQVAALAQKYTANLRGNGPFGNYANLALGAAVTANSTDTSNSVYNPIYVTDGINNTTNWYSWSGRTPNVVQLDLGSLKTFNSLALYTQKNYEMGSYTIEYNNGGSWVQIADVSSNTKDMVLHTFNTITAQYVRVNVKTGSVAQSGIGRINEIELYNVTGAQNKTLVDTIREASNMKLTLTEANSADAGKLMLAEFNKNGRKLYMVTNSTGAPVSFSLEEAGVSSYDLYNPYDGSSAATTGDVTIQGYRALFIEPVIIELKANTPTASAGEEVTVQLNVTENSNISAATLEVNFDNTKLELVSAQAGTALSGGLADINAEGSKITLVYVNDSGVTAAGSLLDIKFRIKDGLVNQTIPVTITVPELLNTQSESLPWVVAQGNVTVYNIVHLAVSNETGYKGRTITQKIYISKNSRIAAADFSLSFDSAKLTFVSATAGTALAGGMTDVNVGGSTVTLAYINPDGLSAEGMILEVTFKIADGLTDQVTAPQLSVLAMTDANDNALSYTITQGTVTIKDYMMGDVNKSGNISSFDALLALQISTGRLTPTDYTFAAADVNRSGTVTAMDALRILQYSTGKITSF